MHRRRLAHTDPPAVLLGGGLAALSVTRSLGAAGVPVYVLGHERSLAAPSRFCTALVNPAGEDLQASWLQWLRRSGPEGAVLLPCGDGGLELVARHRAELVDLGYRPFEANDEAVLVMLDKDRTYRLARAAGVPVPRTARVRASEDLEAGAEAFGWSDPRPGVVSLVHLIRRVARRAVRTAFETQRGAGLPPRRDSTGGRPESSGLPSAGPVITPKVRDRAGGREVGSLRSCALVQGRLSPPRGTAARGRGRP